MNPTTRDELREAAKKFWRQACADAFNSGERKQGIEMIGAYIAGAEYERAKILSLLRSEEANKYSDDLRYEGLHGIEWARWLEDELSTTLPKNEQP
jgi:hypothetical protein